MPRKKRPRQHVIADLSVNHVERYIFWCGYSVERVEYDYGYDLIIFTYDDDEEIEPGFILIQLKATNSVKTLADHQTITFSLSRSDLELWLSEPMPFILIVYDANSNQAYWWYIQAYFEKLQGFNLLNVGGTITVHLPKLNLLNEDTFKRFARYRNIVLEQTREIIHHED